MSVQPEPVKGVVPMVASVVQPVQQIMVQVPAGMAPGMQMPGIAGICAIRKIADVLRSGHVA